MGFRKRNRKRQSGQRQPGLERKGRRALNVEALEDRRMLAVFTVTNLGDLVNNNGTWETRPGSLRAAIEQANNQDNNAGLDDIVFADSLLAGGGSVSINLQRVGDVGGVLEVTDDLNIWGPAARKLTIRAAGGNRIFDLNIGEDDAYGQVMIGGVTLSGGSAGGGDNNDNASGGAIYNRENLSLTEVIVTGNSAADFGGGVFTEFGSLSVERSLFTNNSAGQSGGAIANGPGQDTSSSDGSITFPTSAPPTTNISNSTFAANSAGGTFGGGAIMNNFGTVNITSSTITLNVATGDMAPAGVSSIGNPLAENMDDPPPPKVNFVNLTHNIIWGNLNGDGDPTTDVDSVGSVPATEEGADPTPLDPAIFSQGFNIIGMKGMGVKQDGGMDKNSDPLFVGNDDDAGFGMDDLRDYGGATNVFAISPTSPAVDAGDPMLVGQFEQRGVHFTRNFGYKDPTKPIIDIGAYELQKGNFFVDSLTDGIDLRYSRVVSFSGGVSISGYDSPGTPGALTLREAVEFSRKNPEVDNVRFSTQLQSETDLTPSAAPTIVMNTSTGLVLDHALNIIGPTFPLEIDANDPTPATKGGDGGRVFMIDDGDNAAVVQVQIFNLTLTGADQIGSGGAIFNREALHLVNMNVVDNAATNTGGGLFGQFGTVLIESSTFSGNRASANGGAIFADAYTGATPKTITVSNSTISGNFAGNRGGGIANSNMKVVVQYSTVTNNTAGSTRGSGIVNLNAGANTVTEVHSSIVSGNAVNDIEYFGPAGTTNTFTSAGYNVIGRGNSTASFTAANHDKVNVLNPMLGPLTDGGGPTKVHVPLAGSPVIDAGDPSNPSTLLNDQRGAPYVRVFDGDNNGTKIKDAGSYELQSVALVVDSPGDGIDGVYSKGEFTLREAIDLANKNPLPDTISFDSKLPGISLGGSEIAITDTLDVLGPSGAGLQISGGGSRMFNVDDGNASNLINVKFEDLFFVGASANVAGAAFYSAENLTLDGVTLIGHTSSAQGGAVYQTGGSFSFLDGLATGNSTTGTDGDGGWLYAVNAAVSIANSTISGNLTLGPGSAGGAIWVTGGSLNVTLSPITGNLTFGAVSDGGGVYAAGAVVTFDQTAISGNTTTGSDSKGGGVFLSGGTALFDNSVVAFNNTIGTLSAGGGIYATGAAVTTNNATIYQNVTSGLFAYGGGLALIGGSATVTGTEFVANVVANGDTRGGGAYNSGGVLLIRDSLVDQNRAIGVSSKGGGVYSDGNLTTSSTSIINSTIALNTAAQGGGVYNSKGLVDVRHSTITQNTATAASGGAGIASLGDAATKTNVYSSIVAQSKLGAADVKLVGGGVNSIFSLGFNVAGVGDISDFAVAKGDFLNVLDPLFVDAEPDGVPDLADNGGPADLNLPRRLTYALQEASPAVNHGPTSFTPNSATPPLDFDQRGANFARVQGGRIDIGAFESAFAGGPVGDFNGDSSVDGADLLIWQRGLGKSSATQADGDANGDGAVNATDLGLWRTNFGAGLAASNLVAFAASSSSALVGEQPVTSSSAAPAVGYASLGAGSPSDRLDASQLAETGKQAIRRPVDFDPPVDRPRAQFSPGRRTWSWSEESLGNLASDATDVDSTESDVATDSVFAGLGEHGWL